MFTITRDLPVNESEEKALEALLADGDYRVAEVEIVCHQAEIPREDVAYVLLVPRRRGQNKGACTNKVMVVFFKAYERRRLECYVYSEAEMMPAGAFECPARILEQLAPSTDSAVQAWRNQCRQRLERPLRDGDTIAFAVDVPVPALAAGVPLITDWKSPSSNPEFIDEQGQRYRIPLWRRYPYTIRLSR